MLIVDDNRFLGISKSHQVVNNNHQLLNGLDDKQTKSHLRKATKVNKCQQDFQVLAKIKFSEKSFFQDENKLLLLS